MRKLLIVAIALAGLLSAQSSTTSINDVPGQHIGPVPMTAVATLPTAASAIVGVPYRWTGASVANNCPAGGAGGSGGSAFAVCVTHDGASWSAFGGGSTGISGAATWAQIEAGTAGSGSILGTTTWAQIEAGA